jgi:hypothetical protein
VLFIVLLLVLMMECFFVALFHSYNDDTGLTTDAQCKACPLGRKGVGTSKSLESDCAACGVGTFTAQTAQTQCSNCPRGRYNDDNALIAVVCKECGR